MCVFLQLLDLVLDVGVGGVVAGPKLSWLFVINLKRILVYRVSRPFNRITGGVGLNSVEVLTDSCVVYFDLGVIRVKRLAKLGHRLEI